MVTFGISPTEEIIEEAKNGRMFILLDDENRENEGDVVLPAQFVSPEGINFLITHCKGLVCMPITIQKAREVGLEMMVRENDSKHQTPFTVSVGARYGIGTGISAFDRAKTIQVLAREGCTPLDIASPGHVFPLVAKEGGVFERRGHTEASIDIMRLAGLIPAAVICEILNEDGTMARLDDLTDFASKHGFKIGTIADLVKYRRKRENPVRLKREIAIKDGGRLLVYLDSIGRERHIALKGSLEAAHLTFQPNPITELPAETLDLASRRILDDIFQGFDDVICIFATSLENSEDGNFVAAVLSDFGLEGIRLARAHSLIEAQKLRNYGVKLKE